MSVFTPVPAEQLAVWLEQYQAGTSTALTPIAEGVENTNYFLDTTTGAFVLTLFERLDPAALPFYLGLMHALAARRVSAPTPLLDRHGRLFSPLCGKPAALVSRLSGRPVDNPGTVHCAAIGDWLARLHLALADFSPRHSNPRGATWRATTAEQVRPFLSAEDVRLLDQSLQKFDANATPGLPGGIIHADLFRDNALWSDAGRGQLAGVIDFYFAGVDDWLFDLAVCAKDWCLDDDGAGLDPARASALLAAYHARRPLQVAEQTAWPLLLGRAALRFWLSRLADRHLPRPGDLVKIKDPDEYRNILIRRLALAPDAAPWLS
ncbi:MAG TPA: homoserine kinase [Rhodocyclaceae bacterium]|nr:homoserine kinase [Rhodocyclaceae bacterium]